MQAVLLLLLLAGASKERRDSGTYRVEIFKKSSGKSVGDNTVQLIIEAPVSDVDLSISCLANGEWRLRCSSNGESPQYSWYLGGRPLSEADADLSPDIQTLLLSRNVTGELTCSVSNHVSSKNTSTLLLDACSGTSTVSVTPTNQTNTTLPSTHPGHSMTDIAISVLLSLTVCLCVVVGTFYIRMKKRNTHTPVSEKKEPEDLVYVQVTTGSNGRGRRSNIQGTRVETQDVVYSGVAMANRSSRHKSRKPPAAEAYESEYAEVSVFSKRRGPTESHRPEESVELCVCVCMHLSCPF
ncbi:leucine-rich repeats and immunoglobulin-like domains protein 1 [Clupea harengus]|uniref:leucine-rich repeats and immunoglobulin-like domains protein 1 n=1 Tax=Clupea harengus TaxID=7950 RepID=UPI001C5A3879|nr:leucine-rich repeats and immunoglobulin-like domains protein 1 [Clupea harengus]